ncbi:NAD(P)H-dependent oxidoreductase [Pedobacter hiemivivus]|uniref:NAD(P)H-dependent oxidoreductase n=1 Tax=Pedobacter hiemivivus TaxID=2530454 RepID=A0A4V6WPM3_9SPHI|nr:NAD(P)H-dependent oxidoreductase [Pedobacter hiemivivus]TKC62186.1 NAD(P)H-dependent oxidoreductase [Pedobacter hiemivivus]
MKKNIFAIIGSASKQSSNLRLVEKIAALADDDFNFIIFDRLAEMPHFNPELSLENTPQEVLNFREAVLKADGVLICTPEYIFSIPSGLKNAIEWCVATVVFVGKPLGIITASASGVKGHEELQLIMSTLETTYNESTLLLIQGIKGKFDAAGNITDQKTEQQLVAFVKAFQELVTILP